MSEIKQTKSQIEKRVLAYADHLEAVAILEKWDEKSPNNPDVIRMKELLMAILLHNNSLELEIDDLQFMNSKIREEKNNQIIKIRERYGK